MKFRAIHSPAFIEERILRMISEVGPLTPLEYCEFSGTPRTSAQRNMKALHRQGILHIATHRARRDGIPAPAFDFGCHKDARPAPKLTMQEKGKRYRAKLKAERPDEWKRMIARDKARMAERTAKDAALAEKRRKYNVRWLAKKRAEIRGGPSMKSCPVPRPKFYRNIFDDIRKAA